MGGDAEERVQIAESSGRLGERLARVEAHVADARTDITALQSDVSGLKRMVAWVFGIGTGLGATATFLANGVREWLRG